jgi:hypothetical protein
MPGSYVTCGALSGNEIFCGQRVFRTAASSRLKISRHSTTRELRCNWLKVADANFSILFGLPGSPPVEELLPLPKPASIADPPFTSHLAQRQDCVRMR